MATKTPKKKAQLPQDEVKAKAALDAFNKAAEGKELNADGKAKRQALRDELGKLRFQRIAQKRVPRILTAIASLGNLANASYFKTPEQIKAICTALEVTVAEVSAKLGGAKSTKGAFTLPGFEPKDAPQS